MRSPLLGAHKNIKDLLLPAKAVLMPCPDSTHLSDYRNHQFQRYSNPTIEQVVADPAERKEEGLDGDDHEHGASHDPLDEVAVESPTFHLGEDGHAVRCAVFSARRRAPFNEKLARCGFNSQGVENV